MKKLWKETCVLPLTPVSCIILGRWLNLWATHRHLGTYLHANNFLTFMKQGRTTSRLLSVNRSKNRIFKKQGERKSCLGTVILFLYFSGQLIGGWLGEEPIGQWALSRLAGAMEDSRSGYVQIPWDAWEYTGGQTLLHPFYNAHFRKAHLFQQGWYIREQFEPTVDSFKEFFAFAYELYYLQETLGESRKLHPAEWSHLGI